MLARQFPIARKSSPGEPMSARGLTNENTKPMYNTQSPSGKDLMSPSAMGSKGIFSANKRKAAEIIQEAVSREKEGRVESALRLCEEAAAVFPEKAIVAKVSQLRSMLAKQQQSKKDTALRAAATKDRAGISSDSDIISAAIKRQTPKKMTAEKQALSVRGSPSAVMIRSMATLANRAAKRVSPQASPEVDYSSYTEAADNYDQDHYEEINEPIEPVALTPIIAAPPAVTVTRQMVANTLKARVSEAINYQLLDLLNNGSTDEVLGLHLIGSKRAQYIMELREEGFIFKTLDDLNMISFSPKTIRLFKELNLALAVGAF